MFSSCRKLLLFIAISLFPFAAFSQTFSSITVGQGVGLQVIGLGTTDGYAYLPVWQDSSGTWHRSGILPGQTTAFSALTTGAGGGGAGGLQVIGLGAANGYAYLAAWQDGSGTWHNGAILPGQSTPFSQLITGKGNSSHPLQVIGLGTNGLPYLAAYQDTNGTWTAGGPLPGTRTYSWLIAGSGTQGELQVIGKGLSDGLLYLAEWQDTGGTWHASGILPGQISGGVKSATTINGNHANLNVVGLGLSTLNLYIPDWQDSSSGSWHAAGILPGQSTQFSAVAAGVGNGGHPQVFGLGASDNLVYQSAYQDANGGWHAFGSIPKYNVAVKQVVAASGNLSRLQIIGLGTTDSHIDLITWQDSSGNWYAGADLTP